MHTREEKWHAKREEYRLDVANHYKAKRIARMIQCELGIANLPSVDPWSFKNGSMREMAQLLRRAVITIDSDKRRLGLNSDVYVGTHIWEDRIMKNGRRYRMDVPNARREIMSVERTAEKVNEMLHPDWEDTFVFPKFYKQLVMEKGIYTIWGSTKFRFDKHRDVERHYSGPLSVVAAREVRADWIAKESVRAFKVAVLPDDDHKRSYNCVVGYAATSVFTDAIKPAFGKDIASAVSLCKRRVKAEVMKQMGV